tara:strand:- start:3344 stop:4240 length:897 start_codon:yes stop_codon:yes gene_type:complete
MKNCLNKKCFGKIELLYDYGSIYNFNQLNFDCTTDSYLKPKIYKCKKCTLKFSEIAVEISSSNIENKYKDIIDHIYINEIPYKKKYFNKLFKKISRYLDDKKTVLEIGSYYGVLGNIIKNDVKSYSGLELSLHGSNYAKEKYNLQIFNESVEEHVKKDIKYDIIIMSDVIEHFSDPFKIIKLINEMLNPDGLLIFTTYNIDSFYAKITGKNYHWILPYHLFYFSNKTLKNICLENNIEIFKISNDTRIVSLYYLLNKLEMIFPKFKFFFSFFKKLRNIDINVNLFDLNIYYAKKVVKK